MSKQHRNLVADLLDITARLDSALTLIKRLRRTIHIREQNIETLRAEKESYKEQLRITQKVLEQERQQQKVFYTIPLAGNSENTNGCHERSR